MIKAYVFDFDGVISSNTDELEVLCMEAWKRMGNAAGRVSRDEIEKYRPLIKNAMDWYALLSMIESGKSITKMDIERVRLQNAEKSTQFEKIFFGIRYEMMKKDFGRWLRLYKPFGFVIGMMKKIKCPVYIASSKDKMTIRILLDEFGIRMDEKNIFGKEFSLDKKIIMDAIGKIENAGPQEIMFIEDSMDQIKAAKAAGIRVALASWGYVTESDMEDARNLGVEILDEKNISSIVEEYFDVVDENDNVIGRATRMECHSNPKLIHRGVFVIIFNSKGQMLLQKRSMKKDLSPGKWTCSASGHNNVGESYDEAAAREMQEEIGINTDLELISSIRFRYGSESENDKIFIGKHDGPFRPDKDEIDEVKFFSMEDVKKMVEEKNNVTPGLVLVLEEYLKYLEVKGNL